MLPSTITKRDGVVVPFASERILNAVRNAAFEVLQDIDRASRVAVDTTENVLKFIEEQNPESLSVENIQDIIERQLQKLGNYDIAKAFIIYRDKRNRQRNLRSEITQTMHALTFEHSKHNDMQRENANINADTSMGTMLKYGSENAKTFYLEHVIPQEFAFAHKSGDIHVHDLDFYALTETCCQIDCGKLLREGFHTGHGFIRQPNSINTAAALTCIIIQSNQNEMHGGQSIPNFEYDLAPYVSKTFKSEIVKAANLLDSIDYEASGIKNIEWRMEKMIEEGQSILTDEYRDHFIEIIGERYPAKKLWDFALMQTEKATFQAMEAVIHNLNTMQSRAGSQVPFSSINLGTGTTSEQRMIIRNFLHALDRGLGNGETSIFPVVIFRVKDGANGKENDPNYDLFELACKVSANRMFPNFEFLDAPFNKAFIKQDKDGKDIPDTYVATMGCACENEIIEVRINGTVFKDTFKWVYSYVSFMMDEQEYGESHYFDCENTQNIIEVYDSSIHGFAKVKKIIKNPNKDNWKLIKLANNKSIILTVDHPLPVVGKGRTYVRDIVVGDLLMNADVNGNVAVNQNCEIVSIESISVSGFAYDLETETDRFDISGICSHNCRTRVMANVNGDATTSGRGNLSFTTINLPRLGMLANKDIATFWKLLDDKLDLVARQLLERYKVQSQRHVYNYPFLMGQGIWRDSENLDDDESIGDVLKHGTLTIGFVGLAECLIALTGKHHGEDKDAWKLGYEIVRRMRAACDEFTAHYHMNYSLIGSPAESTASTLLRKDRAKFGIVKNITEREYYTNSSHIPVWFNCTMKEKIDLEAPFHELCNGGHICYVEMDGDASMNPEALKRIILYMKKAGVGYGSVNHAIDYDPVCGYRGIIGDRCPRCGRTEDEEIPVDKLKEIRKKYGC